MTGAVGIGGVEIMDAEIDRTANGGDRVAVVRFTPAKLLPVPGDRTADRPAAHAETRHG